MGEAQILWTACGEVLREQVSETVWSSTFSDVVAVNGSEAELALAVPSPWVKDRIETRYLHLIRAALSDVGATGVDVRVEIRPAAPPDAALSGWDEPFGRSGPDAGAAPEDHAPAGQGHGRLPFGVIDGGRDTIPRPEGLNPRYTFEAFVIGASNRFAQAAALAVAERPGVSYNPLFIYGEAGLGKTHLLQAIGHFVQENYPGYRVRYVSSETFLNEFVDSIRTGVSDSFKRRYRGVDVLMIDDIQFFEGKKETLEEFFHTFNSLHDAGRQVVLSSDRRPDDWKGLEERLRTRFKSGLVIDVQPPDFETRLAILQRKAEGQPSHVPQPVLEYIAAHITDNIRELEGALTRVTAFVNLYNEPLSMELAERVLGDLLTSRQPRVITPDRILDATSQMFELSVEELLSSSRTRPLVNARQIAMYVCRVLTDLSYPQIAKAFCKSDHTTVMHAVSKIEKQMGEKHQIYDQVDELLQLIKARG